MSACTPCTSPTARSAWRDASRTVGSAAAVLRKGTGRSLDLWLNSHGGQLRSLDLGPPDPSAGKGNRYHPGLDFPFTTLTQLTSLKLCNLEPTFDKERSCSCCKRGLICCCILRGSCTPALVQLNLSRCGLSLYTMQHLTAFSGLTMLELSSCSIINRIKPADDKIEFHRGHRRCAGSCRPCRTCRSSSCAIWWRWLAVCWAQ